MIGPIAFDIETASIDEIYSHDPAEYVRLVGLRDMSAPDVHIVENTAHAAAILADSEMVTGHNVIGFDLPCLHRAGYHDLDVLELTDRKRVLDTQVLAPFRWPPRIFESVKQAQRRYGLNATAGSLGLPGKTDDLPTLAERHGGYDKIPLDDPEYRSYLVGDVDASTRVSADFARWGVTEYMWREHRVAALISTVTDNGFRLDRELCQARYDEGEATRRDRTAQLVERYEVPLEKVVQLKTKVRRTPLKTPHTSKEGKAALVKAFTSLGVPHDVLPRTDKGAVSFSGKTIASVLEYTDTPEVRELVDAVETLAGIRTVYGTALDSVHSDGFVHPSNLTLQASGRLSTSKPCLTVYGKRAGRVRERAIFLPDSPDHVLFAVDLSQVDARSVAVHSQDYAYMNLFAPGVDSHIEVAKMIWHDESRRHDAKAIGHGYSYGMGLAKLAKTAGVPLAEAEAFDATMRAQFPRLIEWQSEIRQVGESCGYVENGFGRVLEVNRDRAFTQAPALVGQGTARDVLFEGLLRLPNDVKRMIKAFVHDEVVVSCHKDDAEEIRKLIKDSMTFEWAPPGASRPITFEADASPFGSTWEECYK